MSSNSLSDTISASLFPKARRELLGLLFSHPDGAFYLREIVERTGLGMGHVQRELQRLCRGGMVRRSKKGRHVYFQANESSPVYEELRGLVRKTIGAVEILRAAIQPLSDRIVSAFIFGSVARGEERSQSDLDVMVVGNVSFADVVKAVQGAESRTGREISATVYPPDEFRTKLADGHHFLTSVIEREKLFVLGNEDDLRKLLE